MLIKTFKVSEKAVAKPLKGIFIEIFFDIVFPDKPVLRIVQRMELVEQNAFRSIWSRDEINENLELSENCGVFLLLDALKVFKRFDCETDHNLDM